MPDTAKNEKVKGWYFSEEPSAIESEMHPLHKSCGFMTKGNFALPGASAEKVSSEQMHCI